MAFMAGMAVNFIFYNDRSLVRYELDALYLNIMACQQKAYITGQQQEIVFDGEHNQYICGGVRYVLPKSVKFGYKDGMFGPPALPMGMIKHSVTFPHNILICYPDGILSAGTLYLTDV